MKIKALELIVQIADGCLLFIDFRLNQSALRLLKSQSKRKLKCFTSSQIPIFKLLILNLALELKIRNSFINPHGELEHLHSHNLECSEGTMAEPCI